MLDQYGLLSSEQNETKKVDIENAKMSEKEGFVM